MYDCKAPLSRFYYPDTRRIINAFIIIIIIAFIITYEVIVCYSTACCLFLPDQAVLCLGSCGYSSTHQGSS